MTESVTELTQKTATTCPYCGVGCGVVTERFGEVVTVKGDQSHPANRGRLCVKGTQLGETVGQEGRALKPKIKGREADWDSALNRVADTFQSVISEHGPDAVALYVSGQLLTEDYYVANKWMKGAIGSANIDTNSRLCMASSVAGHKRAFGADTVPCGYSDLEKAELVVLVGSNLAWCHPVLHQRLMAARAQGAGPTVVVLDPRETATATDADLHLALKPGTDSAVFNGLAHWLTTHGGVDEHFVAENTQGAQAALAAAYAHSSVSDLADHCGLNTRDLQAFFQLFTESERVVTVYSQGVNQSSIGTDKVNAIINVHLLSGKIGKQGCGPFSITGQPNAMGGREVGGLANQLAAHMDFDEASVDRVGRFWGLKQVANHPGHTAVDLFEAVRKGQIKALWVMGTNPAVSMPNNTRVREALATCPFVVVSDCIETTDTTAFAHVLLPAAGWGEKDGTVTNSERLISRQRKFLPLSGDSRPDWWIICQVASRMGFASHFDFQSPAEIFREHAALSAFENDGSRDFDIGGLAQISNDDYNALVPTYWPCTQGSSSPTVPNAIFSDGKFYTRSGKAQLIAVSTSGTSSTVDSRYPMLLNSGRVRDQWHTMTRTGLAPVLNRHSPEPMLLLHPLDARTRGIADNDIAQVDSRCGSAMLRARLTASVNSGQAFIPMHWTSQQASSALCGAIFSGPTDPNSRQPELKAEPVNIHRAPIAQHVLLLSREPWPLEEVTNNAAYWVTSALGNCHARFMGFSEVRPDAQGWAINLMPACDQQLVAERGPKMSMVVGLKDKQLHQLIVVSEQPVNQEVNRLANFFAEAEFSLALQRRLIAGMACQPASTSVGGEVVCACFATTDEDIQQGVEHLGLESTDAVAAELGAGGNCGSCLPEVRQLIKAKVVG